MSGEHNRPFLVVPKLIKQPTWGGTYIVEAKQWTRVRDLADTKIGQSYELYDKSNLSLATDSGDAAFQPELADNKSVEQQTSPPGTLALQDLINRSPEGVLGSSIVSRYGTSMHLLLKFTQALGNSFQLHIPDGMKHPKWKPKPESWYYFEPGLITCGVKKGADWGEYQRAVTALDEKLHEISKRVAAGELSMEDARPLISNLVTKYDPWQYVNVFRVEKGTLLDLSPCGIHHSWEEDLEKIPLGNVLYEIQLNVMDDVATLRSFDKGKMGDGGKLRPLTIEEYFMFADRSETANDPATHMRKPRRIAAGSGMTHDRLLETTYYSMDKLSFTDTASAYEEKFDTFRHVFVQAGSVKLSSGEGTLTVTRGHSAFVPAACGQMLIKPFESGTDVLISY